ncbi:proton-coupled folate transporter-like [Oratosquilla oratoria]|uniref:proton-coupled folate transporter-like n=1 Tax=Oratosquilla oratoria TaxID=337810 RepID=UPI003F75EF04
MAGGYKVTVEPVLLLHMLAVFMQIFTLQDLIYAKVCLQTFSEDECTDIYDTSNAEVLNRVQTKASHWVLSSTLSMALPSIIAAQFIGSWSDTYGRKIPLILPSLGGIFSSLVYIIMSVYLSHVPVAYVILASVISGTFGGFAACIMTCMSYIAQVSSMRARTMRVGVIESMVFVGGTMGPFMGGWLQDAGGRQVVFTVILALHAANVIYIIFVVKNIQPRHPPQTKWWQAGFSFRHLRDSLSTIIKSRQENRRTYLLCLLLAASFVMICSSGEMEISYLFVKDKPLQWTLDKYTWFISLKYALGAMSLLAILPLCRKFSDTKILFIGLLGKMFGLILLGFAQTDTMVYFVAVVSMSSTWCLPAIRSSMSKLVEPHEQGKMFASIATVEVACVLVASGLFNSVYPATRHIMHGLTFEIAAASLVVPLILTLVLHKSLEVFRQYENVETGEEANEESCVDAPTQLTPETPQLSEPDEPIYPGSETTEDQTQRKESY